MGKFISFIFGITAYLIFLVAFLYAIGFVGGYFVPKNINSGITTIGYQAYLINILLLSLFAIQHTIMARPAFKKWITRLISPAIERSLFVLLSSLTLILLYWKWQPITTDVWLVTNEMARLVIIGIFVVGWLIVFLSTFMINHFELFGLQQIYKNLKNLPTQDLKFQTRYLYKLVRHPIMLGFIIAFWATPHMTVGHLLFTIITTIYILIAVKFLEEKDLRDSIGAKYVEYQKKVPMIIPFTKFK